VKTLISGINHLPINHLSSQNKLNNNPNPKGKKKDHHALPARRENSHHHSTASEWRKQYSPTTPRKYRPVHCFFSFPFFFLFGISFWRFSKSIK